MAAPCGSGTPAALVLAVVAAVAARRLAMVIRWPVLIVVGWLTAVAWTTSLALVDGWRRGWVDRLTDPNEYLHDLPRIGSVGDFLRGFTSHIIDFRPGSWTTHVSSHPPAATLAFLMLDRIGLGGGAWAGVLVVLVGSVAAVAVPQVLRALGAPTAARKALPFTVFLPAAVWVGVSADGMFAGVATAGLAITVTGVVSRRRWSVVVAFAGGLLLGVMLYLSYGLVLFGLVVGAAALVTAILLRGRNGRWLPVFGRRWGAAIAGVAVVVGIFSVSGFSWFEGLSALHIRYYQGIASGRPYSYFVWANLAALVLCAGPMVAPAIARSVAVVLRCVLRGRRAGLSSVRARSEMIVPALLTLSALLAVLIADISALSKGETERIWLPFAYVLAAGLALLPSRTAQWAMAVQLTCALVVNHLVLTQW